MSDGALSVIPSMDLQDDLGRTLVEFRHADETHADLAGEASELNSDSVSQFNHLLGLVPSSATAVAGHSKQLMTCTFEYSKLIQAKDGSGAIGTVYKEGSNKFGAQARFQEAKGLKSVVTTGLILNVASQVLAQKHLADINERLQAIEQQVKSIRQFLEQSRLAKIETFQEHLQRVAQVLGEGKELHPSTLDVLVHKVQDVRAEVTHIRKDLEKAHSEIKDFDSSSWFGSNDLRVALREKIDRVNHLQREYLLGMQCLLVANLILFVKHGGNKEFVLAGQDYLAELNNPQGMLAQWNVTKQRVALHLSKMKPVFELARSTQANAELVDARVAGVQQHLTHDVAQIQHLEQRLVNAQAPRVLLQVENGQVVGGRYLS